MSETMVLDVSQDWVMASNIQQHFMHYAAPAADDIRYSARCRQLRALGGDCYEFLPLPDHQLAFAIGDASGKSLPAALIITNVQSSLRTAAHFAGEDPALILGAVNQQLHRTSPTDRFVTLFYGVVDAAARTLRNANAGHHPPIVIHRDGSMALLETADLPLGLFTESAYEEATYHLQPGDTILAYTDGVVEALNAEGMEWGLEGIAKAVAESNARSTEELVEAVFRSLDRFCEGRQTDDATVVVLSMD